MSKLIYGVGVNDLAHGETKNCEKIARTWRKMLMRSYDSNFHEKYPSYKNTNVATVWHNLSKFKSWMEEQDYEGKELDKDLLGNGRLYSHMTCCFLPKKINLFVRDTHRSNKTLPVGVQANGSKFIAASRAVDGSGKIAYLGSYTTPEEAHIAWKAYKHSIALQYAEEVDDPRIKEALRTRYL